MTDYRVWVAVLILCWAGLGGPLRAENWPAWRGPRADGTCAESGVPEPWDPNRARWRVSLPGRGHASPIVWGGRVYTVTAREDEQARVLLCLDGDTGQLRWQHTVATGPLQKLHRENSYASSTPATDGRGVFTAFRVGDTIVVSAHDAATGALRWQVRPGTHVGEWGFSNSPRLYRDTVIVDGDSKGDSFLVALDKTDGHTVWRVDRTHRGISYSVPLIVEAAGRKQLIQCGDRCVTGFDPDTGRSLWRVAGPSQEFVASPVFHAPSGLVFVSSSWPKQVLLGIRPDGTGDVTKSHVVWSDTKGAPYVPSPLATGDVVLTINRGGTATCYEAATGRVFWREKLGRHHASPVLVNGRMVLISDTGRIRWLVPGPTYTCTATHDLGEHCYASPAISDGRVYLRGFEHLVCFASR